MNDITQSQDKYAQIIPKLATVRVATYRLHSSARPLTSGERRMEPQFSSIDDSKVDKVSKVIQETRNRKTQITDYRMGTCC